MGSFLKSLLQTVQFLAQLGERLLCWIGFLTCLLGGMEIGFCQPVFLVLAAILGSMCSMCAPIFLAQLTRLLKWTFLGTRNLALVLGHLAPALFLWEAFSLDGTWAFLWVHMRSIASREAEEYTCPWESCLFLAVCTDPATGADTSRECDLPDQPTWMAHLEASCQQRSLGCSTSMVAAQCRHWSALHAVRTGVCQPAGVSWAR